MQKTSLRELIAIVNNGAHPYRVTIDVIDGIGTLVAASERTNNVYTIQIPNLVDGGYWYDGKQLVTDEDWNGVIAAEHIYINEELVIYEGAWVGDPVTRIDNRKTHNSWDVDDRTVTHY